MINSWLIHVNYMLKNTNSHTKITGFIEQYVCILNYVFQRSDVFALMRWNP